MKTIHTDTSKRISRQVCLTVLTISPFGNYAAASDIAFQLGQPANNTVLISLLVLLCSILAYRMLKYRLELLNIQAIDFHALADNAHDGILIVQNKKLVYANQRAADMLAYTCDELQGLNLTQIVHPDEAEEVLDIHLRRLKGDDVPKQYEATFLNKFQNKVPVELTAAVTSWRANKAGLVILRDITDRKLIQQTLQDSEKRYRSLVENSPDGIIIIDVEHNSIIEANEQTCDMFKQDKQSLFELDVEQLSSPTPSRTSQKPLSHYIERALHGQPLVFQHSFANSEGETFNCEVRLSRMPFPKRRLIRANLTDISEKIRYQSDLKQTEARLSSFFDASYEIIFFHENGVITDVNNQVSRVFGHDREDVIGRHVLEFVAPETQELAKANMLNEIEGPYELTAIHKDGHTFPVQIQARTIQFSYGTQRVVSVMDISVMKQTHLELNESRKNLLSIIENMLDTFYRTDKNGKLIMLSPSVEKLFGYKPEEVIGTPITNYYADPFERQFFIDTLNNNNGVLRGYEAAMRHKSGKIIWVSTYARYFYDQDGEIAGVEGVTRDITKQRDYQIALNQANQELEIKIDRRTRQLQDKITRLEAVEFYARS